MAHEYDQKKNLPAVIGEELPAPVLNLPTWAEALRGKVQRLTPADEDYDDVTLRALVTTHMQSALRLHRPVMDQIGRLGELFERSHEDKLLTESSRGELHERMALYCATAIWMENLPMAAVVSAFAEGAERVNPTEYLPSGDSEGGGYYDAWDFMHEKLLALQSKQEESMAHFAVGEHRRHAMFVAQALDGLHATPDRRKLATEDGTWTFHQVAETIRALMLLGADVWDFEDRGARTDGQEEKIFAELCRFLPRTLTVKSPVARFWGERLSEGGLVEKDQAYAAFDRWCAGRGIPTVFYNAMFSEMRKLFGDKVNTEKRIGKSGRAVQGVKLMPGD